MKIFRNYKNVVPFQVLDLRREYTPKEVRRIYDKFATKDNFAYVIGEDYSGFVTFIPNSGYPIASNAVFVGVVFYGGSTPAGNARYIRIAKDSISELIKYISWS